VDDGILRVTIPYSPRPAFLPFHNRTQRWSLTVAHRRAGKTVARINELVKGALTCQKPDPRFAYVAPLFTQAKDVAWGYLVRFTSVIPGVTKNESELRVDFPNGGRVRLYGADNYERMRGIYLDGCSLDEYGNMDPRAWSEVIRPALSDRLGWADFIGTPNGRNHFHELYEIARHDPEWYCALLKASETGLLSTAELADARKFMTDDQYRQEFECDFQAGVLGAYFAKEMAYLEAEKRFTSVPYEPSVPVHTAWDLGIDDSTAIWCVQVVGKEVRVIDYYEASGEGLAHYANWLRTKPYSYGDHYLPHDAEVKELGTGKSRVETLAGLGVRATVVRAQSVEDGINAARLLLPKCWFDRAKCDRGIKALQQYRHEFDEKLKAFKNRPLHDWSSHAADAFRYLALSLNTNGNSWSKAITYPKKSGIV
jgi:phage terminase large subunit